MAHHDVKERAALIVRLFRFLRGWSQEKLAKQAGIDPSEVYRWEAKTYAPSRPNLERLAAAARVPLAAVEILAGPVLWLQRLGRGLSAAASNPGEQERQKLIRAAQEGVALEMARPLRGLPSLERWGRAPEDDATRSEIYVIWLCDESARVAADDASRALLLARAALRVARNGAPEHRACLEVYATPFKANALRVGNDLRGADAAFARARALRSAFPTLDEGRLDSSRFLDLEASLRRAQGRFPEALKLLDRALATCRTPVAEGNILLNRAFTLEQMGDIPGAVTALRNAALKIDGERQPRQLFGAQFNLAVNLCHLALVSG
jgi:transcriptional regulator with XRE-family HTH domain